MPRTFFATMYLPGADAEVEVEYTATAGFAGSYDEPPEGPEIEVLTTGLSDSDAQYAWESLCETHVDDDYDYGDD